jgi:hypothetical protein
MKRLLLATLLTAAVSCGYYYRDYSFGTATETRSVQAPAAELVAAEVAKMSAPIGVTASGNVQSLATVQPISVAERKP